MTRIIPLLLTAALALATSSCVTIQGDTTYAGTYVSNQKDSKALNISGSNATQAIREAEGSEPVAVADTDQAQDGTEDAEGKQKARGAFVILAGRDLTQEKTADTRAVASLQAGNKGAGSSGGDESSTTAEGGATNVAPTVNATGQGAASSGDSSSNANPE
jgi:hypothetical protein